VTAKVSPNGDEEATAIYKVMPLKTGHCYPRRSATLHLGAIPDHPIDWTFPVSRTLKRTLEVSPQGDEGAGDYVRRDDAHQTIRPDVEHPMLAPPLTHPIMWPAKQDNGPI
jgi:hypothetical protein